MNAQNPRARRASSPTRKKSAPLTLTIKNLTDYLKAGTVAAKLIQVVITIWKGF